MPLGPVAPRAELRKLWEALGPTEKYILMMVGEHRHLTQAQIQTLVMMPAKRLAEKKVDVLETYFTWANEARYDAGLDYRKTFSTSTAKGVEKKLKRLVEADYLVLITPSYRVKSTESKEYKEAPSLYTEHYYLSPLGAKLMVASTKIKASGKEGAVGYVPTHREAQFMSIVHETECTEVFISMITCADWLTNDGPKGTGFYDVCRFWHEKDVEEKEVIDQRLKDKGRKKPFIDFKPDGKLTLYCSPLGDFVDAYLEYDSGSSKEGNLCHKIEAFVKYIFWKRSTVGEHFRKPLLLLVSQKPSSFIPEIAGRETSTYTTAIKKCVKENFAAYSSSINDIAVVAVADCRSIRMHGALGACWHRLDLNAGKAEPVAVDFVKLSSSLLE